MSSLFQRGTLGVFLTGMGLAVLGVVVNWFAAGNWNKLLGFLVTKGIEFLALSLGGKLIAIGLTLLVLSLISIFIYNVIHGID